MSGAGVTGGPSTGDPGAGVTVRGLHRAFGGRAVLHGLDLRIGPGEFVALLGRSGSGKSTLLRTLAGLDPVADGGTVEVPPVVSVAFQQPRLLPWEPVWRNVTLGLGRRGDRAGALGVLREVGLEARADSWPLTLSGGEAQRVSLARALVREPRLLLLDEPFGALYALTRLAVHALVRTLLARHRPAVLLVTHDGAEAIALAQRVLVLEGGRITGDREVPAGTLAGSAQAVELERDLLGLLGVR